MSTFTHITQRLDRSRTVRLWILFCVPPNRAGLVWAGHCTQQNGMYRISWLVVSGRTVSSAARPYDGAMSTRIPAPHRDSDGDGQ